MEDATPQKKLKGIYLVPDPHMMKPHFGPSEHIKVGLKELSKYFDIELLVLGNYEAPPVTKSGNGSLTKGVATNNGFVGLLRDIKLLAYSNRGKARLEEIIRNKQVDFIYERGQYLDLRGVLVAKKLGIKHFYEVNWLNFLGIRQFYRSWFNGLAKRLEEYSYRQTALNFFIGTQHTLINVPKSKVNVIQNGIHQSLIDKNLDHENRVDGKIKICYVANLMPHHRFDILVEALEIIPDLHSSFELHLVGYNFDRYSGLIPASIEQCLYGPRSKEELPSIMSKCNVGLISGGPSYSSFMKLFEYAAYKLCVICPDLENIKLMFDDKEIMYFTTDDARSLSEQLRQLAEDRSRVTRFGSNIYAQVGARYTWEKIYKSVSAQINVYCQ